MKPDLNKQLCAEKNISNDLTGCERAVRFLAESMPEPMIILNQDRRLVCFNSALITVFGTDNCNRFIGRLPGELFGCTHAFDPHSQCGTTEFCRHCGSNTAIKDGLDEQKVTRECSILKTDGDIMELRVSVTPIVISEKPLLIINIKDMSDSKRKNVLERLFFHDITNITSGLSAISELLESADNTEEIKELSCVMRMSASSLIDEIRSHKMIFEAENGELQVEPEKVSTMEILNDLRLLYSNSAVSIDKQIKISHESSDVEITTDRVIIKRVLGNLLKNALEAVRSGGNVMLSCKEVQDGVEFSVSNSGVIPRDIQLQLFHKNISTKGAGRGLGTHSVKLLTEKYLRGKVGFVSNEKTGTIFSVYYPFHI